MGREGEWDGREGKEGEKEGGGEGERVGREGKGRGCGGARKVVCPGALGGPGHDTSGYERKKNSH